MFIFGPFEPKRSFVSPKNAGLPVRRNRLIIIVEWHTAITVEGPTLGCRGFPIGFRYIAHFATAEALEGLVHAFEFNFRRSADEDQSCSVSTIPRSIGKGYKSAEGSANNDRFLDAKLITETFEIITPMRKILGRLIA